MSRRTQILLATLALAAVAGIFAFGRTVEDTAHLDSSTSLRIEVDVGDRTLAVRENGVVVRTYEVTVGAPGHPTPTGTYRVDWLVWNPSWNPPDSPWARGKRAIGPGPDNPMGKVKMFFRRPAYYIHGTNRDDEIGQAASHGCVRLRNEDVVELAQLVMEHGGEVRPPGWFRRVINRFRDTEEVRLETPVPVVIGS